METIETSKIPNHEIVSECIIESLQESYSNGMFFSRFSAQEDKDFILDFLVDSVYIPNLMSKAIRLNKILFTSLPSQHKFDKEEFNFYFQKFCISISNLFSTSKNICGLTEGVIFFQDIINVTNTEYFDFLKDESWITLLSSIIGSFTCNDLYYELESTFLDAFFLGRCPENEVDNIIESFSNAFSYDIEHDSRLLKFFEVVISNLLTFPNQNSTLQEIRAHKNAIKLFFTVKKRSTSQNRQLLFLTCFQGLIGVISSRHGDNNITKDPYPIESILKLFADSIFAKNNRDICDHLDLLTNSEIEPDSPWIPIFSKFFKYNIKSLLENIRSIKCLNMFTARKPLLFDKCFNLKQLLFMAHQLATNKNNNDVSITTKRALEQSAVMFTTVLSNIYQREIARDNKQLLPTIASVVYKLSYSDPVTLDEKYILADMFNLILTNNIDLLNNKLCRASIFKVTQKGFVLPAFSLLILTLLPLFHDLSDEEARDISNTVIQMADGLLANKLFTNSEIQALAISALALASPTSSFVQNRSFITKLFSIAKSQNSDLLKYAALFAQTPICFGEEARKLQNNNKHSHYYLNGRVLTLIEPEDGSLHLLIRSKTGINHMIIDDHVTPPEPEIKKCKYENITLEAIYEDVPEIFKRSASPEKKETKSRCDALFLSLGINPIPRKIDFDSTEYDSLCESNKFKVQVTSINVNSTDFSGEGSGPRFDHFMKDLETRTKMPFSNIEYTREENKNALIIFNETQRELLPITKLEASLIIEVSMNDYLEGENITYCITPVKLPRDGYLFPFIKEIPHAIAAQNMPMVIASFIFMFLSKSKDPLVPNIVDTFITNCEKREKLLQKAI